jgi:hypothetical protein
VWGGQGPYKDCRATDDDDDGLQDEHERTAMTKLICAFQNTLSKKRQKGRHEKEIRKVKIFLMKVENILNSVTEYWGLKVATVEN